MSARWPVLEHGISSMERHIPVWLFKAAERLDNTYTERGGLAHSGDRSSAFGFV